MRSCIIRAVFSRGLWRRSIYSAFFCLFVLLLLLQFGGQLPSNLQPWGSLFESNYNPKLDIQRANRTTSHIAPPQSDSVDILMQLHEAMSHSWKAYKLYAWGRDEVDPLERRGLFWMNAALTMIDSLDTLHIFNMNQEFLEARDWIDKYVQFDSDNDRVNVFESTIRLLGGLLGAFHLSNDTVFLSKALVLGEKLLHAFQSPSGLPYSDINLATLKVSLPAWSRYVSLAEVATLQLEFNDLAVLTKNVNHTRSPARVQKILHKIQKESGLLSISLDPGTGEVGGISHITLGARGDSYYEYLLKTWVQTGKQIQWLENDYREAIAGVQEKLVRRTSPNKLTFVGELHSGRFSPKMDHLVCFLPGTLAYGYLHGMPEDHLELAKRLLRTCVATYNQSATGLSPEITHFNVAEDSPRDFYVKKGDAHCILRPETVESLFYLYRITKDPLYRTWGRQIFEAFQKHTRLPHAGYAPVQDVNALPVSHKGKMESFWMAETLKYFYLLFSDQAAAKFDLKKWVFNSEAHPFPIPTSEADISILNQAYTLTYLS
uniref:alpha-1,2-Mannosidase n=3 Tax=Schistocephalus solidus TaxID=70667 RepID=A0A0V0J461_SCHSO